MNPIEAVSDGRAIPISRHVWIALRLFNLYRLIVAGLFTVLGAVGRLPPGFTGFEARMITSIAAIYLIGALGLQFALERQALPFQAMRNLLVVLDVSALGLLMHASGGAAGGYGLLLVVAIAGACLVSAPRASVAFAALASLAVLAETAVGYHYFGYPSGSYTQAGLLGAALFATALLSSTLAEQARRSEALAAERARAIAQLSELNDYVVQRMRAGILVLDRDHRVMLSNAAARRMLGETIDIARAEGLREPLAQWRRSGQNRKTPLQLPSGEEIIASFSRLAEGGVGETLVFLDDAAEIQQRAQQIKLASLGRLTMSIAHEIRNPLGAISHAAQLLAEADGLAPGDARLAQIVVEQSGRVNDIIKNVMLLGRRAPAASEALALRSVLEAFTREFAERHALPAEELVLEGTPADLKVQMDRRQLEQVLWNLAENALRYSRRPPRMRFTAGVQAETDRPYLDVRDTGPGMPDAVAEQVFEPFFTGEQGGTGLGLYLARELCEANQASLLLLEHGAGGCCFRLLFAHPDRQQLGA